MHKRKHFVVLMVERIEELAVKLRKKELYAVVSLISTVSEIDIVGIKGCAVFSMNILTLIPLYIQIFHLLM